MPPQTPRGFSVIGGGMDRAFVYAILTSIVWGVAPALEKIGLRGAIEPYQGVVIRSIAIALVSIAGLMFMGRANAFQGLQLNGVLFVVAGGLVAGLIGQFTFYSALKAGDASIVVPVAATYPIVALVISIIFLGEPFTWQKAAGIGLVVAGVMLVK